LINALIFHIIIVLASLIVVVKSADLLVYGISNYARKLGISDYLIGFLVVSIGTALPEFVAAITGALANQGAIVVGTVLGSNLFKIPIIGAILLVARKTKMNERGLGNAPVMTLLLTVLPLLLLLDGSISRVDGGILLFAFFMYIGRLWSEEGKLGKIKRNVKLKHITKDSIIFIGSLVALLLAARWLVSSSIILSYILNISPYVVGLLVIGIGASMPELTVQLKSMIKHHQDIAFGNVLGSIVANSTLVLGLVGLIKPFFISVTTVVVTIVFIVVGTLFILLIMQKKEAVLEDGLILLLIYVLFLMFEFVF
jgi:cation:H+ antiporter